VNATAVVGIGNILLGDDGAGVWLARRIAETYRFAPEIDVIDGGTLGLGLIPTLSDTKRLLVIDAAKTGSPPGSVSVLRDKDVPAVLRTILSAHEASLCDLLAALTFMGRMPDEFIAVGIEPLRIEPSLDLSEPVQGALPVAERTVLEQLRAWEISAQ
jgi:hydrogenase maturation protease